MYQTAAKGGTGVPKDASDGVQGTLAFEERQCHTPRNSRAFWLKLTPSVKTT
jgi:hypothetical protein